MDGIREYLVQVTAAGMICGVVNMIAGKKGSVAASVRIMTVILMTVTMASPLVRLRLTGISDFLSDIRYDGSMYAQQGSQTSKDAVSDIIRERSEAYILDKAALLGADIRVELTLSRDALPIPVSVTIYGAVSPVSRQRLQKLIRDDLGIPLEAQTWN